MARNLAAILDELEQAIPDLRAAVGGDEPDGDEAPMGDDLGEDLPTDGLDPLADAEGGDEDLPLDFPPKAKKKKNPFA